MHSVIEEMYYDNIHSSDRPYQKNPAYTQARKYQKINMEKLLATLNEAEKELFEKYICAVEEAEEIVRYDAFSHALKLGTLLMTEVFAGLDAQDTQEI